MQIFADSDMTGTGTLIHWMQHVEYDKHDMEDIKQEEEGRASFGVECVSVSGEITVVPLTDATLILLGVLSRPTSG